MKKISFSSIGSLVVFNSTLDTGHTCSAYSSHDIIGISNALSEVLRLVRGSALVTQSLAPLAVCRNRGHKVIHHLSYRL